MPLRYRVLLRALTAEDVPESLNGLEVDIFVDDRGYVRRDLPSLDRWQTTLRVEPRERESFRREMHDQTREIQGRYRGKGVD